MENDESKSSSEIVQGSSTTRIEYETGTVLAMRHPREEQQCYEKLMCTLDRFPEYAGSVYYSIPYTNEQGKKVPVEGPTIKAAQDIKRCWGNMASGSRYADDLDERVLVEGVAIDYENNIRESRQISVSKIGRFKGQDGKPTYRKLAPDRLNMAIQAGMSKAERNAIFQVVPRWMTDAYFQKAKQIVAHPPKENSPDSIEVKIQKAKLAFIKQLAVTETEMNDYVESLTVESQDDLFAHLKGLWNSIKEGECTVDSVFRPKPESHGITIPKAKEENNALEK
jgi:hypothetical protein